MGGQGWAKECEALLAFYRDQAAKIKAVRDQSDSVMEDLRRVRKTPEEREAQKQRYQERVDENERYSRNWEQPSILAKYEGEKELNMLDREMYRRSGITQKIWSEWHNIENRENRYEDAYRAYQIKI